MYKPTGGPTPSQELGQFYWIKATNAYHGYFKS